jgi:hypothetical protein
MGLFDKPIGKIYIDGKKVAEGLQVIDVSELKPVEPVTTSFTIPREITLSGIFEPSAELIAIMSTLRQRSSWEKVRAFLRAEKKRKRIKELSYRKTKSQRRRLR